MRTPSPAARTMALAGLTDISGVSRTVFVAAWIISRGFAEATARHAVTDGHDRYATETLPRSDFRGLRQTTLRCLFLLVAGLEEVDADLIAVDPGQLAAAVCQTSGRQQQEEFLEMQSLDGAIDSE